MGEAGRWQFGDVGRRCEKILTEANEVNEEDAKKKEEGRKRRLFNRREQRTEERRCWRRAGG